MSTIPMVDPTNKHRPSLTAISPMPLPPMVSPVQFVTPEGALTRQGREQGVEPSIARLMYRDMFLARRFDTEALALQRQGELGLWLMTLGQEAAQVGSIRALRDTDHVFPSYREHAAAMCRGISSAELLAQWRGVAHAGWDPDKYRFNIYSLVLGAQTLHATGYAMGVLRDRSDEIVMTYFGDGATSQGDVNEALNWAAAGSVPVVFFCQNNQYAISTPAATQSRTALHQRAAGFGLDSYLVDGNDALAVHAVTTAAASRVRAGFGPAFIEAVTYRMAGHSTSDDPGRYRPDAEVALWRSRDPLSRLKALLEGMATPSSFFDQLDAEADGLATETRRACLSMADPRLEELFDMVYAEAQPEIEQQAKEYAVYQATFVRPSIHSPMAMESHPDGTGPTSPGAR